MLGIIAGDVIGSVYEGSRKSKKDFPLFGDDNRITDDTVLSVATVEAILNGGDYLEYYQEYYNKYPNCGYGGSFKEMAKVNNLRPYDSYGNGSAMRVGPIGWAFDTIEETLKEAQISSQCTHSHHEGIKGAKAVAMAIYMARNGHSKEDIKEQIEEMGYDLSKKTYDFRQGQFDVTCQGTIPRCMAVFLETDDFESAMRKAVSLGGDVDTNCCIVGAICDGMYGLPKREIVEEVYARLPKYMAEITTAFTKKYIDKDFVQPDKVGTMSSTLEDSLGSLFSS